MTHEGNNMIVRIHDGKEFKNITIEDLFKKYYGLINKICFSWISYFRFDNSIEVKDLHQDLCFKLLYALEDYRPEDSSLKTYISKIAKNHFINKRKSLSFN